MDHVCKIVKTDLFKGFVYGMVACIFVIFAVAAATQQAITFTASNAIVLTPVPKFVPCPICPCTPDPVLPVVPTKPNKGKKGDIGDVSMLDCVSGCKCNGSKTEGCTCFFLTPSKCTCVACSCEANLRSREVMK